MSDEQGVERGVDEPVPEVDQTHPDDELRGRRPGDDPFLPEEGFFWWLPRALMMGGVALALFLLIAATIHHGKFRLVLVEDESTALLQRGRFAPWGWEAFIPEGELDAWAPVAWPTETVEAPLKGELRVLAEDFLAFIRARAAEVREDQDLLGPLEAQEAAFEAWYQERWDEEPPQTGSIASLRSEARTAREAEEEQARLEQEARDAEAAQAAAAELADAQRRAELEAAGESVEEEAEAAGESELDAGAQTEPGVIDPFAPSVTPEPTPAPTAEPGEDPALTAARAYASDRRAALRNAEDLLSRLPPPGQGTPEDARDRAALERFILSMDTPAVRPR
jgi:hypothetical protein